LDCRAHHYSLASGPEILTRSYGTFQDYVGTCSGLQVFCRDLKRIRYQEGGALELHFFTQRPSSEMWRIFYVERKLIQRLRKNGGRSKCSTGRAHRAVTILKRRRCTKAVVIERNRHRTTHLDARNFTVLRDGRQMLCWEMEHGAFGNVYHQVDLVKQAMSLESLIARAGVNRRRHRHLWWLPPF